MTENLAGKAPAESSTRDKTYTLELYITGLVAFVPVAGRWPNSNGNIGRVWAAFVNDGQHTPRLAHWKGKKKLGHIVEYPRSPKNGKEAPILDFEWFEESGLETEGHKEKPRGADLAFRELAAHVADAHPPIRAKQAREPYGKAVNFWIRLFGTAALKPDYLGKWPVDFGKWWYKYPENGDVSEGEEPCYLAEVWRITGSIKSSRYFIEKANGEQAKTWLSPEDGVLRLWLTNLSDKSWIKFQNVINHGKEESIEDKDPSFLGYYNKVTKKIGLVKDKRGKYPHAEKKKGGKAVNGSGTQIKSVSGPFCPPVAVNR